MKTRLLVPALAAIVLAPLAAGAQQSNCPESKMFFEYQVTNQARWIPDSSAVHPVARQKTPQTVVQFVVDTIGIPDMTTFRFVIMQDSMISDKARRFASTWRFTPSILNGCRVRQLVQTPVGR